MKTFKREISRKNFKTQFCEQKDDTAPEGEISLTHRDYLLMFTPEDGYFIAKQGLGTWCEVDINKIFRDLKQMRQQEHALIKIFAAMDIISPEETVKALKILSGESK